VLALVNYAAHEFSDLWSPPEPEASSDDELDEDLEEIERLKTQTVAIIDAGASSTSLILVSGEAHWAWTIESGGEDLTSLVARATKTTHAEAEKLKRNPAALRLPSRQYEPVEQRMEETRQRLEWVYADALKQNPRFEVAQSWCSGGACLAHQWIQRIMLQKHEEMEGEE
jgi:Tfp pilus assembly PilM family ATPase